MRLGGGRGLARRCAHVVASRERWRLPVRAYRGPRLLGPLANQSFLSGANAASSCSSAWRTCAMAAAKSANYPSGFAPAGGSITKLRRSQAIVHVNWA
jgi:hypothetical protein